MSTDHGSKAPLSMVNYRMGVPTNILILFLSYVILFILILHGEKSLQ